MISTECSDEKGRQRQAARRSHKIRSCMNARRRASMDMAMDLKKHGRNLLPGLRAALARPSASSSHRRTCRPRRRNRLRLPKPRCGGDCQHPCPSPSRLSGLFGVRGALAGDSAAAAANYQNGFSMSRLPSEGLRRLAQRSQAASSATAMHRSRRPDHLPRLPQSGELIPRADQPSIGGRRAGVRLTACRGFGDYYS